MSEQLNTLVHIRIVGFLLHHGDSRDTIKAQSIDGVFDGTYVFHRNRYHQNKGSLWRLYRHFGSAATPIQMIAPEMVAEYHGRYTLTPEGWRIAERQAFIVLKHAASTH